MDISLWFSYGPKRKIDTDRLQSLLIDHKKLQKLDVDYKFY